MKLFEDRQRKEGMFDLRYTSQGSGSHSFQASQCRTPLPRSSSLGIQYIHSKLNKRSLTVRSFVGGEVDKLAETRGQLYSFIDMK